MTTKREVVNGANAPFQSKPLSPVIGAEITGLDLSSPLPPEIISALRTAWLEHQLLLFRAQDLTEEQQIRFAEKFGSPVGGRNKNKISARRDQDPRIMLITNIRKEGKTIGSLPDGELQFHSDSAFLDCPLMGTLLYGVELPSTGGNTLFANTYLAYDALSPAQKKALASLEAINVYDYATQVRTGRLDRAQSPHATHPVIRTHPETGRKGIYVNRLMTEEIVDFPTEQGDPLLAELFDLIERRDFMYEHVWQKGDLLMWDNRCTQHARTDFPENETRLLRRVGLEGDKPW
ncbi:MAG: TauD/TfdA family dioxygenase [Rhodospirillaceae bacterium]|nr:TauD/TfdA family dioxygenase [Rhodospirillaceae bacterium]MBT5050274.1 TauD/TfdA family dioxygenase [Rhodospirillaceae bacterium]